MCFSFASMKQNLRSCQKHVDPHPPPPSESLGLFSVTFDRDTKSQNTRSEIHDIQFIPEAPQTGADYSSDIREDEVKAG